MQFVCRFVAIFSTFAANKAPCMRLPDELVPKQRRNSTSVDRVPKKPKEMLYH